MKPILIFVITLSASVCFCEKTNAADRPEKPNIVLMLVDDLGWQDVKCYDIDQPSPMETPNIDALAKNGVRFLNGYSPTPVCASSRCAIMSGKHAARTNKTHVVGGHPPYARQKQKQPIMDAYQMGRMKLSEITIAEALKTNGYRTGHTGKWHLALDHYSFPQPVDQGFDFSSHVAGKSDVRGVQNGMRNRLEGFATTDPGDPYRIDENGFPTDPVTVNALNFMKENKADPFFLYYATWLVHAPLQSRSQALLEKYVKKLGVEHPTDPVGWDLEGQNNPYYCAMVETLDYYVGLLVQYLNETEDPRWPGHKLIDNTYIIFTSDNGGMEGHPGEIYTDNYPLDRGKINAREGGVRVPFIITGHDVKKSVVTDVMANGIDFYPTIMNWTGTKPPEKQTLDGSDLSQLLKEDPNAAELVIDAETGAPRDTLFWHFPQAAKQSTIRKNGFKFIYNYEPRAVTRELFQLYDEEGQRVDIEEMNNLVEEMPEKAAALEKDLFSRLGKLDASRPHYNPHCTHGFMVPLGVKKVCSVVSHDQKGDAASISFKENGAKVVKARILYTLNGGDKKEEWFPLPATLANGVATAKIPSGTTHYYFNLMDENHFLVSYPEVDPSKQPVFSGSAIDIH